MCFMVFMKKSNWFPVLLWLLFALVQGFFFYNFYYLKGTLLNTIISIFFQMASFYINSWWLYKKFSHHENTQRYVLAAVVLIIILGTLNTFCDSLVSLSQPHRFKIKTFDFPWLMTFIRHSLWVSLMFFISSFNITQKAIREEIERNRVITEEKLNTELSLLKAQINPHFLFNALNNIFSLSYMKSERAPDAILKLSGMLRYVLDDCQQELVPLYSEIKYIEDYVDFQRLRMPMARDIDFTFAVDNPEQLISPMLFIPFLENSFKYSRVDEEDKAFVRGQMKVTKKQLVFILENSIPKSGKIRAGSEMGIKNVKKRLNIVYPAKHHLVVENYNDKFVVNLEIQLS